MKLYSIALITLLLASSIVAHAEEDTQTIALAEGKLSLTAPSDWQVVEPRSRMLELELSVAAPEGIEAQAGRLTIMAAGGSIEANLSRWVGQFSGTEGGANRDGAKIDKETIEEMQVTLFEHSGTYLDGGGRPFGPKTPRENYRMLAAIIETGIAGNYFIKLVGPQVTLAPCSEPFREMILSVKQTDP